MRKAVLAHVFRQDEKEYAESYMEECRELCRACGIEVAGTITQQSVSPDPRTYFRKGKLEELARMVQMLEADCVVFCRGLTIAATDRIAAVCGVDVLDRTSLILQIFSQRARTRQARLQVEVARFQYALPRLTEDTDVESHERGGSFSNRGAGEQRSAVMKRKYQHRIKELKDQLRLLEKENQVAENRRRKSMLRRAALVGYTNAGKSSFMNAVLALGNQEDRGVFEKDMLFATLDTSVRNITHHGTQFLLYDTVGFVSDLPHELVEAFKTTLSSAADADLLIHVIDASDPHYEEKIEITRKTLEQIGAGDIPVLPVFNKMDLVEDEREFEGFKVSCRKREGLEEVLDEIAARLYPAEEEILVHVPYSKMGMIAESRRILKMETLEEDDTGMTMRVSGPKEHLLPYRRFRIDIPRE